MAAAEERATASARRNRIHEHVNALQEEKSRTIAEKEEWESK
jgi:hypothetical protein